MAEPSESQGPRPSEPSLVERAADRALAALRHAPPLALLAVCAGLFELALARLGWHGLTDLAEPETVREIGRWARFPRNLAAVAGGVTLVVGFLHYLRFPSYAPIGRRLAVAAFAGIFVPSIAVATFMPHATLRPRLVIFGLAAANVLVTLLGLSALRYRAPIGLRIAVATSAGAAFLTLVVIGISQLTQVESGAWSWIAALMQSHPSTTQTLHLALRHLGEVCWMAVLFGGAWTTVAGDADERTRVRLGTGLALTVVLVAAILGAAQVIGHRFPIVIFGSFRLMLFLDDAPALYAIPLAVGVAGGLVGLGRARLCARQLGVALLFWVLAGYGPHTPIQLLYLVLGGLLLIRSAQAYDPAGAWRQRQPWLRLTGRAPASQRG